MSSPDICDKELDPNMHKEGLGKVSIGAGVLPKESGNMEPDTGEVSFYVISPHTDTRITLDLIRSGRAKKNKI
ncbi:MIZ1 family protein [Candidatus Beckwithbacteria bacterium]|nr:MIZ1 family protein [Candidatus Beckwithbacteria bacterium]